MKVSYFEDTDTLYVAFSGSAIVASRDLDANTVIGRAQRFRRRNNPDIEVNP
jgi:uncharacterized protein YuzE